MKKTRIIPGILLTGFFGFLMHPTVIFGTRLPDMGWLAWFFLVPLLVCLRRTNERSLFLASFSSAVLFYSGTLYWLIPAMINYGGLSDWSAFGVMALLVVILSLYFATALSVVRWVGGRSQLPLFLTTAVFLQTADFLLTSFPFNGFPWCLPAYSQGRYLSLFQWIDLTGVYGLNFLIYLVNALMAEIILTFVIKGRRDTVLNYGTVLGFLVVISFAGSFVRQRSYETLGETGRRLSVALVQANIPQEIKWDPLVASSHLDKHMALTDLAVAQGAQLVIWPEAAYPYTVDLQGLSGRRVLDRESLGVPILSGSVSQEGGEVQEGEGEPLLYNSALLIDRHARVVGVYHKRHLVPFGEYVPLKKWLMFASSMTTAVGDVTPGKGVQMIGHEGIFYGSLICYEDIFPDLARSMALNGANLLINITNDAWYGDTSAQHQHLVFSQFRALENRRYLVRATNTGMTALIDPRGVVIEGLKPFSADILVGGVQLIGKASPYSNLGDFVAWACMGLVLLCIGSFFYIKYKERRSHVQGTARPT